ncbi:B3/4 domain-containing protein [Acerihabitans sp. KWT182]|uniref:B3/4 domain-containing protein n=1 Tax=Acerihabitans sp. KWT182 TaxID=3157919 RepID=A0AAU7Q866_9GAMM
MQIKNNPVTFNFDNNFKHLGINEVCFATLYNIDNYQVLPQSFVDKYERLVRKAVEQNDGDLQQSIIEKGYHELILDVNRSVKKFPPSAFALTEIIRKKGTALHINPFVDIYNMYSLETRLSIGAHDLDKINGEIRFQISQGDEPFYPIGGGQKKSLVVTIFILTPLMFSLGLIHVTQN